jgi:hypothetical protein
MGSVEELVEVCNDILSGSCSGAFFAPAVAGSIKGTDVCELSDFWLNERPFQRIASCSTIEDDGRASFSGRMNVHPMPAHIDELAYRGIFLCIDSRTDGLIQRSA